MNHAHHGYFCRRRCSGRTGKISSDTSSQVRITLSDDLLCHLRRVAQEKHIPLRWLVAGLICDTLEPGIEPSVDRQAALTAS